ncbi:ATP-binding protein [Neolewinella antarctica]|uniref:Uncharacterized protein YPO0396 n=1 Tax=Neolewinella antarctica TaxID=442734 RepID=A0ABX0XDN4_9BACT|nr:ATP-binding protein [Neolewinella antarctica]NJC27013.1 uncharacterized protein YPO0396 [Neolewinella antarctica]
MTLDLNTNIDNAQAGFRLTTLEVLNWGTFHDKIWTITPGGQNALLTGNIGSGKSTLVDAITTLLVPNRQIVYNKAAGAETRERSLITYVQGAYKNEKVGDSARARDVFLREAGRSYSVLIANFTNEGTGEKVALTQVLWTVKGSKVERLYLVGTKYLSVSADFSDFNHDINTLRRRLKGRNDVEVHTSFTRYFNEFRRRFGIKQPEALDLFYQTVSMKQVGNLTEFVRERMLGRTEIMEEIDSLVKSYAEADTAHQAVQSARKQLETLEPLMNADGKRKKTQASIRELNAVRNEIPRYFAYRKLLDLKRALSRVQSEWESNRDERATQQRHVTDIEKKLTRLNVLLSRNDLYQQLESVKHDIDNATQELDRRRTLADGYAADLERLCTSLENTSAYLPATNPQTFADQRRKFTERLQQTETDLVETEEERSRLYVDQKNAQTELREVEDELKSLRERPTLIPSRNLNIRAKLLAELQLEEEELPFAGELLRVKESARDWEGAIERVLHGLGLSILVADRHYERVSEAVNRLNLGGRVVYLRTLTHRGKNASQVGSRNLPTKVEIKGNTEHYDWLEQELTVRYNYECCENLEDFRRAARGLTRNGQVKANRMRHDKDDRFRIDDRKQYILGWTNLEKIAALETERERLAAEVARFTTLLYDLRTRGRALNERRDVLRDLVSRYPEFRPLDFAESSLRLQDLHRQRENMKAKSGELDTLETQIQATTSELKDVRARVTDLIKKTGGLENQTLQTADEMYRLLEEIDVPRPDVALDPANPDVPAIINAYRTVETSARTAPAGLEKLLAGHPTSDPTERQLLTRLDGEDGLITKQNKKLRTSEIRITRQMSDYRTAFPNDSRDFDDSLASLPDYHRRYETLKRDKLPQFEDQFRRLLREGTIQKMVMFRNRLDRYTREIDTKISSINEHLRDIDYDADLGTYVAITSERVNSSDITSFKQDLKACIANTISDGKDVYNEQKFQRVKQLLDRFRGTTETDRRWTARVTDVRQWYEFGADERYREDDKSKEFYTDSSGKSGGQKEKLAYTILASAIAFQFGLQVGKSTDRSFRFVVIDEAFGRGSDDSTRYGLELFKRLNLQLLIVTPLQKINVIEDYVAHVHFVDNPGGMNSRVRNISIAEYRTGKK